MIVFADRSNVIMVIFLVMTKPCVSLSSRGASKAGGPRQDGRRDGRRGGPGEAPGRPRGDRSSSTSMCFPFFPLPLMMHTWSRAEENAFDRSVYTRSTSVRAGGDAWMGEEGRG